MRPRMILFIHEAIKLNINILIYYTSLQNNECFNFSIKNVVEQTLNQLHIECFYNVVGVWAAQVEEILLAIE